MTDMQAALDVPMKFTHNPYHYDGYEMLREKSKSADFMDYIPRREEEIHDDDDEAVSEGASAGAPTSAADTESFTEETQTSHAAACYIPPTVLRTDLIRHITFYAYPDETNHGRTMRTVAPFPRPEGITQMFLGQVPFRITDAQLLFVFTALAGTDVLYIERVMQGDSRKGCIQLFLPEAAVQHAKEVIHKRVLFDQGGFWFAATEEEVEIMHYHCTQRDLCRHKGMPFNCAVLEESTSTYTLAVQAKEERTARRKPTAAPTARGPRSSVFATPSAYPAVSEFKTCSLGSRGQLPAGYCYGDFPTY